MNLQNRLRKRSQVCPAVPCNCWVFKIQRTLCVTSCRYCRNILAWWEGGGHLWSHTNAEWGHLRYTARPLPSMSGWQPLVLRNMDPWYMVPTIKLIFTPPPSTGGRVYKSKFCLFVCLSVITSSFSEYWVIWWFRQCKPYIFWKHITLATSTPLFWLGTTKYRPVPPFTEPVPPSTNH